MIDMDGVGLRQRFETALDPDQSSRQMWKAMAGDRKDESNLRVYRYRYEAVVTVTEDMLFGDAETAQRGIAEVVAVRGNEEKHKTKRRMVMETFLSIAKMVAEGLFGLLMLCAFGFLAIAAVLGLALERGVRDDR